MAAVEIKPIESEDFHIWLPLWKGYQRFYEADIPESVTAKAWSRFLDPIEPMCAALAFADGQASGLVHSIYHRTTWSDGEHCYLQDLFVAPSTRGRGLGRALIEHVYAEAARRGASRVYWTTHQSNNSAMQLYDAVGERSEFVQYVKILS